MSYVGGQIEADHENERDFSILPQNSACTIATGLQLYTSFVSSCRWALIRIVFGGVHYSIVLTRSPQNPILTMTYLPRSPGPNPGSGAAASAAQSTGQGLREPCLHTRPPPTSRRYVTASPYLRARDEDLTFGASCSECSVVWWACSGHDPHNSHHR